MGLTLVRHTTPDVPKGTCYGRTDLGLARSFEEELADLLARTPGATRIVSSPLVRCWQLATRLSDHFEIEVCRADHWIEMDFGAWEGVRWADIPRAELDGWAADFMGYKGHGGESVAQLEDRIRQALEVTPPDTIVVTHSGCIRAACAVLDLHDRWDTETQFGGIVSLP